jgi:hypothetical protein
MAKTATTKPATTKTATKTATVTAAQLGRFFGYGFFAFYRQGRAPDAT